MRNTHTTQLIIPELAVRSRININFAIVDVVILAVFLFLLFVIRCRWLIAWLLIFLLLLLRLFIVDRLRSCGIFGFS